MRKQISPDTIARLVLFALLILLAMYIGIASHKNLEANIEITPTISISPEPTITSTPTPTAEPTVMPTPTVAPTSTPTPTPEPERVEVPDVGDVLIKEAYEHVQDHLETFAEKKKTLYDTYTEKELELLFRVVEAEATDYCVDCKSNVASVIFNRLKAGWWGGDLTKNIMAKRQFEVITNGRYKRMTVTEETIQACEIAFDGDTTQGALFFDSTKGKSWAHRNKDYIFSDHAHWFYK